MVGIITISPSNKRFHIGYNLTVLVGNATKTTTNDIKINGANSSAAIASIKQEILIKLRAQKPLIKINFCVELEG